MKVRIKIRTIKILSVLIVGIIISVFLLNGAGLITQLAYLPISQNHSLEVHDVYENDVTQNNLKWSSSQYNTYSCDYGKVIKYNRSNDTWICSDTHESNSVEIQNPAQTFTTTLRAESGILLIRNSTDITIKNIGD